MATWLTHLRVADQVLSTIRVRNIPLYFAGSVAPDTSIPPDISHFCREGDKTACDLEGFFQRYLLGRFYCDDTSFYIGYYVHLFTDVLWHRQKITPLFGKGRDVIQSVKQGWKDADCEYLREHSSFYPVCALKGSVEMGKKWFDYDSVDQLRDHTEHIFTLGQNIFGNQAEETVKREIEQFVKESADTVAEHMRGSLI